MSSSRSYAVLILLILLLGLSLQLLNYGAENSDASGKIRIEVTIIESPGCPKCVAMERSLERIDKDMPLNITKYYYYTDEGHRLINERKVKDSPAVIIGSNVINYRDYNGDNAKMEQLIREALAENNTNNSSFISLPDNKSANMSSDGKGPFIDLQEFSLYTVSTVLGAGLVVGFNPCIIGILVFLAASVLSSTGRKGDLMKMVVFFSFGIFTMYFLFGLGMQRLLQTDAVSGVFRYILTAFLLIAGLSQVFDATRLKRGKPSIFRTDWALKYFQEGVDKRRFSSYFLIGALFSLVKVPCLSGIYLAILDLLSTQNCLVGVAYLFSFNLGVILPTIVMGSFMAVGMSPEQVDTFREDHRVGMRLITGLTLIILAPLIYWQWI
jgi:cytochrome c biogenesis protein CcdA/glutaredoxin